MPPGKGAPFASLPGLEAGGAGEPPSIAALNRLAADCRASGLGPQVEFVSEDRPVAGGYEVHILRSRCVPTRPGNWHDAFNALAWCRFPATKTALNALHVEHGAAPGGRRSTVRDALTLFDECGVLAVSCDAELIDLLRAHAWEEACWRRRPALLARMRLLVVGHATADALRAPFHGLCAKVLYREVGADWLALDTAAQRRDADAWLGRWLTRRGAALTPSDFAPLPLLGIPGVGEAAHGAAFFRDQSQFRPRRGAGLSGLRCV